MISKIRKSSGRIIARAWVSIFTLFILSALVLPAAVAQVSEPAQASVAHEGFYIYGIPSSSSRHCSDFWLWSSP